LENWVAHYGGFALFALLVFGIVGLPIPDETLLVLSGYLIYRGTLNPPGTWLGAVLGSMCGITCSYMIGRTLGAGFIHSRFGKWVHITEKRIQRVHDWFHHLGHWALFVGYYIPGVRHFTAIVAGTSRLEYRYFALFAYSGACLWVTSFMALGYFLGDNWKRVFEMIHRNLTVVGIAAIIVICAYALTHLYYRQRRARK
jgi:membrane protein DedA with SNARE-associated domain